MGVGEEIQEALVGDISKERLLGSLLVDYEGIGKYVEKNKDSITEEMLIFEVVVQAFGCIQPVDVRKLSEVSGISVRAINKGRKDYVGESEAKKIKSKEYLRSIVDILDFSKLFRSKSPIAVSEFVREIVLDQPIRKQEEIVPLVINNLEINMTNDMRTQIVNTTAGQKELFFSGEKNKALPEQVKPTDEFLTTYTENMREVVKSKLDNKDKSTEEEE